MKTYVLEAIKRIKRFSEKFDVSTTLCDKTWVVFNDTGERELYIFQPDGTTFITKNGVGIKGKWHWISANQSLIINKDDNVIMLHPEYIDKTILALNIDGTNKMAFLIEEKHLKSFPANTLAQLEQYFIRKERYLIEKDKLRVEWDRLNRIEAVINDAEKRITKHKQWLKDNEESIKKEARKLKDELSSSKCQTVVYSLFFIIFVLIPLFDPKLVYDNKILPFGVICLLSALLVIIAIIIDGKCTDNKINKWKDEHPNDPRKKYLD